jgi:hypothetical protein
MLMSSIDWLLLQGLIADLNKRAPLPDWIEQTGVPSFRCAGRGPQRGLLNARASPAVS